jgi:hypothetical protein
MNILKEFPDKKLLLIVCRRKTRMGGSKDRKRKRDGFSVPLGYCGRTGFKGTTIEKPKKPTPFALPGHGQNCFRKTMPGTSG